MVIHCCALNPERLGHPAYRASAELLTRTVLRCSGSFPLLLDPVLRIEEVLWEVLACIADCIGPDYFLACAFLRRRLRQARLPYRCRLHLSEKIVVLTLHFKLFVFFIADSDGAHLVGDKLD